MKGPMKESISRSVSRSAARSRLIHLFVRNEGREPFQWHHNRLREVSQDEFVRVRWRGTPSMSRPWRSHWAGSLVLGRNCARSQRRGLCRIRRDGRVLLQRLRGRRRRRRRLGRGLRRLLPLGHHRLRRLIGAVLAPPPSRAEAAAAMAAAAAAAAATVASARAGASVRVRWRRSLCVVYKWHRAKCGLIPRESTGLAACASMRAPRSRITCRSSPSPYR